MLNTGIGCYSNLQFSNGKTAKFTLHPLSPQKIYPLHHQHQTLKAFRIYPTSYTSSPTDNSVWFSNLISTHTPTTEIHLGVITASFPNPAIFISVSFFYRFPLFSEESSLNYVHELYLHDLQIHSALPPYTVLPCNNFGFLWSSRAPIM